VLARTATTRIAEAIRGGLTNSKAITALKDSQSDEPRADAA